jgi:small-conductance mechanosensitive channel
LARMDFYGIRLIGFNNDNGRKLLFTLGLILIVIAFRVAAEGIARWAMGGRQNERFRFWLSQGTNLAAAAIVILGILSIWFDDPTRLTTAAGLVTAGLAFALQKVVTSVAGYFVILRSSVFTVGDRILMAGVRGDVIRLGFIQTTIMEMGQPPGERPDDPRVWVKSRQFTGRIVTVTNDKIFDTPVFNYTREFPYLWEEITVPVGYKSDRGKAERILLKAAGRHAVKIDEIDDESIERMKDHFFVTRSSLEPRVYLRLTDNWIELSTRFLAREHGSREMKDAMSREILSEFEAADISIASATFEIIGLPPVQVNASMEDAERPV